MRKVQPSSSKILLSRLLSNSYTNNQLNFKKQTKPTNSLIKSSSKYFKKIKLKRWKKCEENNKEISNMIINKAEN